MAKQYESLYTTEIDPNTGYFREKRSFFKDGEGRFACNSERSYELGAEVLAALATARAVVENDPNNHDFQNGTSEGFHGFRWRDGNNVLHQIGVWSIWDFRE